MYEATVGRREKYQHEAYGVGGEGRAEREATDTQTHTA